MRFKWHPLSKRDFAILETKSFGFFCGFGIIWLVLLVLWFKEEWAPRTEVCETERRPKAGLDPALLLTKGAGPDVCPLSCTPLDDCPAGAKPSVIFMILFEIVRIKPNDFFEGKQTLFSPYPWVPSDLKSPKPNHKQFNKIIPNRNKRLF